MDILLVIGVLCLGAVVFVFISLAMVLYLLRENERMQMELERHDEDFWKRIEESNNFYK
jgi:predicted PurR-regulated permease PerM